MKSDQSKGKIQNFWEKLYLWNLIVSLRTIENRINTV
jgi:hypothetical protein